MTKYTLTHRIEPYYWLDYNQKSGQYKVARFTGNKFLNKYKVLEVLTVLGGNKNWRTVHIFYDGFDVLSAQVLVNDYLHWIISNENLIVQH